MCSCLAVAFTLQAPSLQDWDSVARCCCVHVVGSLKVWWSTTQQSVASASERGMFIAEHRSVATCCVCSVAELLCLSWVVMLCVCEQVVDVELGSGVPHISNLQALASPSSIIWPQALFDLDFTGNKSVHTQHTWESLTVPLVPFWAN